MDATQGKSISAARQKARHQLLLNGLGKALDLNAIDWQVKQQNPSASPSEIQNETLEVIRSLVSDELFRLGGVPEKGEGFVSWNHSLDHSMRKVSHNYVRHYNEPERWMFSAWIQLTDKGEQLAQSLEKKDIDAYR